MQRVYQAAGLLLLALALFIGWTASGMRYFSPIGPGPGFFPLWLCGILGLLALAVLAEATLRRDLPAAAELVPSRDACLRILGTLLLLFLVAFGFARLGFRVTMFGFYLVLLPMLGRRNPVEVLVLAALGSFGVHELFGEVLKSPLPAGPFGL